jgi:long-chain acyl-CoA synthetase
MPMNLFSILETADGKWPDATAVVDDRHRLSYRELHASAASLARELQRTGIQAGDKVGVIVPKGAQDIIACFAVVRLGAILVCISPASKQAEITRLGERLALDAFIYNRDYESLIPRGLGKKVSFDEPFPVSIQRAEKQNTATAEREQLLKLNTAAVGFSSGTTSESKAIILSHDALLARGRMEAEVFSINGNDCILYLLSIAYGFAPPVLGALLAGAKLVMADAAFIHRFPELVGEHGVSLVYASPLVYQMILNEGGDRVECLRGARHLVTTGSRLADSLANEFRAKIGHEIVNRYGLNECGMVTVNMRGDGMKRGSVGVPAGPEVEIKIDNGVSSDDGLSGELLVRGAGMFEGYGSPWRARDAVTEEGWFRTGDVLKRDNDGYYWVVGRIKDMINVGGLKVVPSEIEDVLLSHPDVEEALVFGRSDPRFGEVPHAKIKLVAGSRAGVKAILQYVNEKVAFYKSPRSIEIVDQLPKTSSGKIKRPINNSMSD